MRNKRESFFWKWSIENKWGNERSISIDLHLIPDTRIDFRGIKVKLNIENLDQRKMRIKWNWIFIKLRGGYLTFISGKGSTRVKNSLQIWVLKIKIFIYIKIKTKIRLVIYYTSIKYLTSLFCKELVYW